MSVTAINPSVVAAFDRDPVTDLKDLLAALESGELDLDFGVLVFVRKDKTFSWARVGSQSVVEAVGLCAYGVRAVGGEDD